MIHLYMNKLINATVAEGDTMNYHSFVNGKPDPNEVRELMETVPFFADRRLILIRDSGWFKGHNSFSEAIEAIPPTTVLLFVESDVDKTSDLFKAVKEHGYVSEINGLSEEDLRLFIGSTFKKHGLGISASCADYLLERVGADMNVLTMEMDKLAAFCKGQGEVKASDVKRITTPVTEGQIFAMMDCIVNNERTKAIELYGELLGTQESPLRILYMLTNNFYSFYKVMALADSGISADEIATRLSMRPFVVKKFLRQKKRWTLSKVLNAVEDGNDMERRVKSGDLEEHMAAEMFLFKYTTA